MADNSNSSSSSNASSTQSPLNNSVYAQALNNLGTVMAANLPKQLTSINSLPDADTLNLLRNNAINSDLIGAAQYAKPGYASGMDQAQLAGLQQLAGHNFLQGFTGLSTTPTAFAPTISGAQQQAAIQQQQNKNQGLAAQELGATSKDYLNNLYNQSQTAPGAVDTAKAITLGTYGQRGLDNAVNMGNTVATPYAGRLNNQPDALQGIASSGTQNYLSQFLPGVTNPISQGIQQYLGTEDSGLTPAQIQEENRVQNQYVLPGSNETDLNKSLAYTTGIQNTVNEMNQDPQKNPDNVTKNIQMIKSFLSDPNIQNNINNHIHDYKNAGDLVTNGLIPQFETKYGSIASTPEAIQTLKDTFSSNPDIAKALTLAGKTGTFNIGALNQVLDQTQTGVQMNALSNQYKNDIIKNVQGYKKLAGLPLRTSLIDGAAQNVGELNNSALANKQINLPANQTGTGQKEITTRGSLLYSTYKTAIAQGLSPEKAMQAAQKTVNKYAGQ